MRGDQVLNMRYGRLTTDLHTGPQLAVSTPVVNLVDIVPLEREDNLNVKDSVELDRNTIDDSLKDLYSIKPNVKDPSKERRPAASRSELRSIWMYVSVWQPRHHLDPAILNMVYFCQIDIAVETCSVVMTKIAVARDF